MAQFTVEEVTGGFLVEGTDDKGKTGTTLLVSATWELVLATRETDKADDLVGEALKEVLAPLLAVKEQLEAEKAKVKDWSTLTISEGEDGTEEEHVHLDYDGTLLRILDEERFDLLRWVGDDTLVALRKP